MSIQTVENAIKQFGGEVDNVMEGAANIHDKSIYLAWRFHPVRYAGKMLALCTGVSLIAGAMPLVEKGYNIAAKACFISGGVVIVAQILELTIFRRK